MQEQELATIKRPNEIDHCSREEFERRIKEIAKCKRDIIHFAENYFRVINLDKGLHVIKLYDVQKEFLQFLVDNNKVICVSGRQQGKSTIYCIYALWLATFFPEKKIMLLANKLSTALELMSRVATSYEYMPKWLKCSCLEFNKSSITFGNMSSIKAFASSSDAARGHSCNVLILDEFAFLQKNLADKLFTSMYPVVSSSKNGKVIIVSTPNGTGNLYYEIWQQANTKERGKNLDGWKPFEMYWWQVPGHDDVWKAQQIAAIGEQRFAQEFNNEFLANSTTKKLVPEEVIEKHKIKYSELKALDKTFLFGKKQKIFNEQGDKFYEFTMWHEFNPKKTYMASGDCAEGVGSDASVLYVWDVTDLTNIIQCAKFSSNQVSPVEFAFITSKILSLYNKPYYICERNGVGSGYLDSLKITYGYPNIVKEGKSGESGVFSHVTTKGKACIWSREMFTTTGINNTPGFNFTIYDKNLIDEFETFCKKDTSGVHTVYAALPPAHDDHIMALIWLCWILQPDIVERYFICVQTFTSQFEKIYPKLLEPLQDYTATDINTVTNDPLYKEFLDFKDEVNYKLTKAYDQEKSEEKSDYFIRAAKDPYFHDRDDGESWNVPSYGNKELNSTLASIPSFFIV